MASETELAWAAGLFDGEGTFQIAKDNRSTSQYHARMRIGMCHRGAVQKFADIMGLGNVVRENTPAENSNYKQFRWSTSGQQAVNCAVRLYPYLVVKQHEADILIRWEPLIANGRNIFLTPEILSEREKLYWEMKAARSTFMEKVER